MKTPRLLCVALVSFCLLQHSLGVAETPDAANAGQEIRTVLQNQAEAWNRGDIEGFMNGYARSETTAFVSGDQVTHGWQPVFERYKKRYPDRAAMGKLTFSEMEVQVFSTDAAVAKGRWELERAGDHPRGRFTLLLSRLPEGWRVVYDHTSAAEK